MVTAAHRGTLGVAVAALLLLAACARGPSHPVAAPVPAPSPAPADSAASPAQPPPPPQPWNVVGGVHPQAQVAALAFPSATTGYAVEQTCPPQTTASADCTLAVLAGPSPWQVRGTITGLENPRVGFADAHRGWVVGEECPATVPCAERLLLTGDGGTTWQAAFSVPAGEHLTVEELLGGHLWVGTSGGAGGLKSSADGGAHWQALHTPAPPAALDFLDVDRGWMASVTGRVYGTSDGGRTWAPLAQLPSLDPAAPQRPLAFRGTLDFVDARNGWVQYCDDQDFGNGGCGAAVLHTADGGKTWTRQFSASCVTGVGLRMFNPRDGVLAGVGGGSCNGDAQLLFTTSDGGLHWTPVGHAPGVIGPVVLSAPGAVWAGVEAPWAGPGVGTVMHSPDSGHTWVQALPRPFPVRAVAFLPDGQTGFGVSLPATPGRVLATTDGGDTWHGVGNLPGDAPPQVLAFADARHGWALSAGIPGGTLYGTTDGGASWQQTSIRGATALAVGAGETVWAALTTTAKGAEQLHTSADGGHTWAAPGPFPQGDDIYALATADGRHGWALANCGGCSGLLRTTDGGATWRAAPDLPTAGHPDALAAPGPGDLWVAVDQPAQGSALLHSADGGSTWSAELAPGVYARALDFSDSRHGWLLTQDGRLFATSDAGATWRQIP